MSNEKQHRFLNIIVHFMYTSLYRPRCYKLQNSSFYKRVGLYTTSRPFGFIWQSAVFST